MHHALRRQFYGALDSDQPQPLRYADFPTPLEKGAVRLALLLLPPALGEAALQAARAIVAALPPGAHAPDLAPPARWPPSARSPSPPCMAGLLCMFCED
jgi:hypothetical protein